MHDPTPVWTIWFKLCVRSLLTSGCVDLFSLKNIFALLFRWGSTAFWAVGFQLGTICTTLGTTCSNKKLGPRHLKSKRQIRHLESRRQINIKKTKYANWHMNALNVGCICPRLCNSRIAKHFQQIPFFHLRCQFPHVWKPPSLPPRSKTLGVKSLTCRMFDCACNHVVKPFGVTGGSKVLRPVFSDLDLSSSDFVTSPLAFFFWACNLDFIFMLSCVQNDAR